LDESLRAKLESALALLERATSIEGTRLARVLKRIRFKLERARIQTLRATNTERPVRRLSAACAATIQRLIADEEQRIANP